MSTWETVGHIGVDSGTVMLVDPCYIVETGVGRTGTWEDFVDKLVPAQKDSVALMHGGVVVTTAHGDGQYAVEVRRNDSGLVIEVRIRFE